MAVINQKGGVDKTTTSINLSTGLVMSGRRVLLIDLDPQAHATIGLGIEPESYNKVIHDVLVNKQDIRDIILSTPIDNLFLAPAHIRLERAEQLLNSEFFRGARVLTLAKSAERIRSMIRANQILDPEGLGLRMFLFAPHDRFDLENPSRVLEPVWVNGRGERVGLT